MESAPLDVRFVPTACVLGLPSSGVFEVAQRISEVTGSVHLRINEIIESMINIDSKLGQDVRD